MNDDDLLFIFYLIDFFSKRNLRLSDCYHQSEISLYNYIIIFMLKNIRHDRVEFFESPLSTKINK